MTRFEATMEDDEVVEASRDELWRVLTTPDELAPLVPRVERIQEIGDRWCWMLTRYEFLGISIQPSFTERIDTAPPSEITFTHDPGSRRENAGARGEYRLEEHERGTHLWIRITVHLDLPLPRFLSGAVESIMRREMRRTGEEFSANLLRHVGAARTL